MPHGRAYRAAVHAGALLLAIPAPYGRGVLGGEAAKPQVARVFRGARLAGGVLSVRQLGARARAARDDLLEHLRGLLGHRRAHHARALVVRRLVDGLAAVVHDFGDDDGVVVNAAVGDGGVGVCHFQRVHPLRAQSDRVVGLQVGGDAAGLGHLHDLVGAERVHEARVDRVDGFRGGGAYGHAAAALALDVAHHPGFGVLALVDVGGRVGVEGGVGVDTCGECGQQGEGLERRARLPAHLRGEVELVAVVVLAANHGHHVAVVGIDGHERGIEVVVAVLEVVVDGVVGGVLAVHVERCVDGQAALGDF